MKRAKRHDLRRAALRGTLAKWFALVEGARGQYVAARCRRCLMSFRYRKGMTERLQAHRLEHIRGDMFQARLELELIKEGIVRVCPRDISTGRIRP